MLLTLNIYIDPVVSSVKWTLYENVYKYDSKELMKVCPKINNNHFQLNNLTKMKVKYACQVCISYTKKLF